MPCFGGGDGDRAVERSVCANADHVQFFLLEHLLVVSIARGTPCSSARALSAILVNVAQCAQRDPIQVGVCCGMGTANSAAPNDAGSQCHFTHSFRRAHSVDGPIQLQSSTGSRHYSTSIDR